jgi:hypothetical protein
MNECDKHVEWYILYGEMFLAHHRNLVASLAILGLASASSVFFITYGFPCLVRLETSVYNKFLFGVI